MTLFLAILLAATPPAPAADAPARAVEAARPPAKSDGKPAPRHVLKLDEVTVEGRIQKPQAFFILPRSSLHFDESEKKESFLPRIKLSCEKDPF